MSIRRSTGKKSAKKGISRIKKRISKAFKPITPDFQQRQAEFIRTNKSKLTQAIDRMSNSSSITEDRILDRIIETEKQENAVLTSQVRDLQHKEDTKNREIDSLRTRMFQQADEIAEGKRTEMDEKAKKFAGWMTAGLVGIGLMGVAYYSYVTGNDEDDARNMYEFWQDEAEYTKIKWWDSKIATDPDKTVPDHRFGDPVNADWIEEYEDLND